MIKLNGKEPIFPEAQSESDNNTRSLLRMMLSESGLSLSKAVKRMGELHPDVKTSTQNISNKLARDSINFSEFMALADACGYTVSFDRTKQKEPTSSNDTIRIPDDEPKPIRLKNKTEQQSNISFEDKLLEGMADYQSIYYGLVAIAGENALTAAQFIKENVNPEMSKKEELYFLMYLRHQFNIEWQPTYKTI